MDFPLKLIQLLRITNRVAALTGAGASQESGLRTFRDSQAGLWAQYKPEDLASPQAFAPLVSLESFSETSGVARDPKLIWDWYAWRREAVKGVRPNAGHYALAEIEKYISEFTIITQNVDGLHRMAGNQNVLELHGNIQRVRCSECYTFTETWGDDTESVPQCEVCGGLLRPDVVWFGEALPRDRLEAAVEAARTCESFFSIGTSGVVQPAASLAYAARNRGAVVVEINAEATPLTSKADYFLQGKSGEILPELVKAVWG